MAAQFPGGQSDDDDDVPSTQSAKAVEDGQPPVSQPRLSPFKPLETYEGYLNPVCGNCKDIAPMVVSDDKTTPRTLLPSPEYVKAGRGCTSVSDCKKVTLPLRSSLRCTQTVGKLH